MTDNPFNYVVAGEADWATSYNANFRALDRGFHITERAGTGINTGMVLWLNSGGFFFPYDPNSTSISPHAFAYTAASSGDSFTALAWGVVRSLDITSPVLTGRPAFVSALTPGLIVSSPNAAPVGYGVANHGFVFNPLLISNNGVYNAPTINSPAISNGRFTGTNSFDTINVASTFKGPDGITWTTAGVNSGVFNNPRVTGVASLQTVSAQSLISGVGALFTATMSVNNITHSVADSNAAFTMRNTGSSNKEWVVYPVGNNYVIREAGVSDRITISAARSAFDNVVKAKTYTVATLPTGGDGDMSYVTDALTPVALAAVVGGGAVHVPVYYNGGTSAWDVM